MCIVKNACRVSLAVKHKQLIALVWSSGAAEVLSADYCCSTEGLKEPDMNCWLWTVSFWRLFIAAVV